MKEYDIVTADSADVLRDRVEEYLSRDWELVGGVAVACDCYEVENMRKGYTEHVAEWCWAQAVVRETGGTIRVAEGGAQ